jgi:uncharacterized protein
MRTSKMRRGIFGLLIAAGVMSGAPGIPSAATSLANTPAADASALAERTAREGHAGGLEAIQTAAQQGNIQAQLDLARIYTEGKLVQRDEARACEIYGSVADSHSQIDRNDPAARLVADAFRSWALCYVKGAPAPGWEQNLGRAAVLFYQAGVMFEDPESLYELAKLFLKGQGVAENPRLAVHFLFSAARKHYAPAQAMLGSLMWEGKVLKRQGVNGLALIKLALDSARPEDKAWIDSQYEEALITASKDEEAQALALVDEWKRAYSSPDTTGSTPPVIATSPAPPAAQQPPAVASTPPVPPRAPNSQPPAKLATPSAPAFGTKVGDQQQTEYGTQSTGAKVPPAPQLPSD